MSQIKKISKILIIILTVFILTACSSSSKLDNDEAVAWTNLRLAAASSKVDDSGTISEDDFNMLEQISKKNNSKNDWFSSSSGTFYANTKDTSDNQVTFISNGTYVATFTVEYSDGAYKLLDYTFEKSTEKGYYISIE